MIPLDVACGLLLSIGRSQEEGDKDTTGEIYSDQVNFVAMKVNKEVSEDSSSTWPYFVGAAK